MRGEGKNSYRRGGATALWRLREGQKEKRPAIEKGGEGENGVRGPLFQSRRLTAKRQKSKTQREGGEEREMGGVNQGRS